MLTILSLPIELIIEIMIKGDHKMLLACQRVCRTLNVIIRNTLPLQYIISLAACGMRDSLPMIVCSEGIAERLQRLHQHEAAWREVAWSGVETHKHDAVHEFPIAISGGVLAFLVLVEYPENREFEYLLHLFRVPSKLRGVPSQSWELPLGGLGKVLDIAIDSAQDLLVILRDSSCDLHVRSLSSGKVHPSALHSGTFSMGLDSSEIIAGRPVICCDHVAAVVRHPTRTVVVWNWKIGNQVAVIRPGFVCLGIDVVFLDETHLMIAASVSDPPLTTGQDYKLILTAYNLEHPTTGFGPKVVSVPYCFHIPLPMRTGSPFRRVRINVNTASFSSPVAPCPRGYFYADPEDRILTLEVTDGNCDRAKVAAELNAPVRTFLAYMEAHPPTSVAISERGRIDVPWEAWGPHGAHLVRPPDQEYIFYRPRTCGMRVLGAPLLGKKSVVITDYHPGRVARSVGLDAAARVRARASPEIRKGAQLQHASLTCVTKEVPLPKELQEISNLWVILCEDALLVFEYLFLDGFFLTDKAFICTF